MLDFFPPSTATPALEATELEALLNYLNQVHRVDLTGYKRSTLRRRVLLQMQQVGVEHYQGYLDYLQQHPDEVTRLMETIFINCTQFFRDRQVWGYLADHVVPQLLAHKAPDEPIRIWSAGCSTGEETYSLAMLLMEALGVEQVQQRVLIYGTDVDADAIVQARQGDYPTYKVEGLPAGLQAKYFVPQTDGYCWRQDLPCPIRFQQHDLIQHPPFQQIDLLLCRNVLIYLTPETQLRVLLHLHQSLQDHGFLLLGKAESLVTRFQRSLFSSMHQQSRIFKKVPTVHEGYGMHLLPPIYKFK